MYSADSYQSIKSPSDLEDEQIQCNLNKSVGRVRPRVRKLCNVQTGLYQTDTRDYERKSVGRRGGRR